METSMFEIAPHLTDVSETSAQDLRPSPVAGTRDETTVYRGRLSRGRGAEEPFRPLYGLSFDPTLHQRQGC